MSGFWSREGHAFPPSKTSACGVSSDGIKPAKVGSEIIQVRKYQVKGIQFFAVVGAALLMNGCVVQSTYSKTISVTKDANGKIIQTVESETVVQPANGYPMRLEKVKGIQPQ